MYKKLTKVFLGLDVGSVSTKVVAAAQNGEVIASVYLRTCGKPVAAVQDALNRLIETTGEVKVGGVGTTGSGRYIAAVMTGADIVKNEITSHAIAACYMVPGVQTILEIGGQDSKIIIIREGTVTDFAMNTVCAAGTGSFLDQQAARMGLSIDEFSRLALEAESPVRIAGRCAVFAESDMIHKQQMGHSLEDIIAGLCEALVRNYLNNVGKGKEILEPVVFQGGVAANAGMCQAFNKALHTEVIVPKQYHVMGAYGAALLAMEAGKGASKFRGFEVVDREFKSSGFECRGCSNNCEVVELLEEGRTLARWGDRCGRWSNAPAV